MDSEPNPHEARRNEDTHEHIDHAAEQAKQGAANTLADAKDKLDAATDHAKDGLEHAADAAAQGAHRAADKADDWRERGAAAASGARDRVGDATDRLLEFVRDKPVESIAIALAAGWLVGRLLNRGR